MCAEENIPQNWLVGILEVLVFLYGQWRGIGVYNDSLLWKGTRIQGYLFSSDVNACRGKHPSKLTRRNPWSSSFLYIYIWAIKRCRCILSFMQGHTDTKISICQRRKRVQRNLSQFVTFRSYIFIDQHNAQPIQIQWQITRNK